MSILLNFFIATIVAVASLLVGVAWLPELETDPFVLTNSRDLPPHIRSWYNNGTFIKIGPPGKRNQHNVHSMFTMRYQCRNLNNKQEQKKSQKAAGGKHEQDTRTPVVLLHGFPSSSFEFHRVVPDLCEKLGPVILFDHVGFGFSDKPQNRFTASEEERSEASRFSYSVIDHAENALMLLEKLNVTKAHFIAHDMGDSILNEIIGRRHRGTLPERFMQKDFFQSVIFTNGGMVYKHINARISQIILSTPVIGALFSKLLARLDPQGRVLTMQLKTVWASAPPSGGSGGDDDDDAAAMTRAQQYQQQRDEDIADINTILHWRGGHAMTEDLIRYLNDRRLYESRWHPVLRDLTSIVATTTARNNKNNNKPRCGFVWGDSDAVAPMAIANALHETISQRTCEMHILRNRGHFVQLEAPAEWVEAIMKIAG